MKYEIFKSGFYLYSINRGSIPLKRSAKYLIWPSIFSELAHDQRNCFPPIFAGGSLAADCQTTIWMG